MIESRATQIGWHMGIHPQASGMRIRSIERAYLQLGEALRVEMVDANPDADGLVHLQYYVVTDVGPWALWRSCGREEIDDAEASLRQIATPFAKELAS